MRCLPGPREVSRRCSRSRMRRWQPAYPVAQSPQRRRNRRTRVTIPVTKWGCRPSNTITETQAMAVVRGEFPVPPKRACGRRRLWGLTSDRHAGARAGNGPGVWRWGEGRGYATGAGNARVVPTGRRVAPANPADGGFAAVQTSADRPLGRRRCRRRPRQTLPPAPL